MAATLTALEPWLQPAARALVQLLQQLDPSAQVTSTRRSYSEQAMLYRRYLAGQSLYPAAPPGRSYHELGRAIDVKASPAALTTAGALWNAAGGKWSASDPIHFQA